jgi:hypothetical protein
VVIDQGDFRFSSAARSGCAINTAIEVLGDPWSMLVLRDVIFSDRHHFRELLQGSEEGIAPASSAAGSSGSSAAGLLTGDEATRRRIRGPAPRSRRRNECRTAAVARTKARCDISSPGRWNDLGHSVVRHRSNP